MGKNILIACEESQTSCMCFRALGFNAFSCDIQDQSGGHPEWHIMGDCLSIIDGSCEFKTTNGDLYKIDGKWDLIIAHPPCTFLSVLNGAVFANLKKRKNGEELVSERIRKRREAACFFMNFWFCDCNHVCIENPLGFINSHFRQCDQIIDPYMFGDNERKRTCLWFRGLLPLMYDESIRPPKPKYKTKSGRNVYFFGNCAVEKSKETGSYIGCGKERSKTFPGIARAFAEQWGRLVISEKKRCIV